MHIFHDFPVLVPLFAGFIAELGKLVGVFFRKSKIELRDILQSGGLPSGHATFVSALVSTIWLLAGMQSLLFAIAAVLAIVVMYDAMKIRRAAGKHAAELNQILGEKKYAESLGHTPFEVFVGLLFGTGIAFCLLSFS